jgi:hypothetical protein
VQFCPQFCRLRDTQQGKPRVDAGVQGYRIGINTFAGSKQRDNWVSAVANFGIPAFPRCTAVKQAAAKAARSPGMSRDAVIRMGRLRV